MPNDALFRHSQLRLEDGEVQVALRIVALVLDMLGTLLAIIADGQQLIVLIPPLCSDVVRLS